MCYAMAVLWELVVVLGGLKLLGAVSSMQRGEGTENVPERAAVLQLAATRGDLMRGASSMVGAGAYAWQVPSRRM